MIKRILFQGDSITDCGRNESGIVCKEEKLGNGYPGMVASELLYKYADRDLTIFNRGISGNRVVDLYARWKADCINLEADLLSVLIGVNDTWHEVANQNGVGVKRYERLYREILTWAREKNPNLKIVILEPFLLPQTEFFENMVAEINERRAVSKKIAEDFDATFIPLQSILDEACKSAPKSHWSLDGVHPTLAGHRVIANAYLAAIEPLLG